MPITRLERSIIKITGDGAKDWLSGLITNKLSGPINFAALLTPQGKIIADFFVISHSDYLWIDTAQKFETELIKHLSIYRLRAPIIISAQPIQTYAIWNDNHNNFNHIYTDPRHEKLGERIYITPDSSSHIITEHTAYDYNQHRLGLGIPDSQWDFETSETFPASANMDLLNGVDFKKGCFVGQEVVSRMYRKTHVKKRMRALQFDGDLTDGAIMCNGRIIGDILYKHKGLAMAMIRHDRLPDDDTAIMVDNKIITLLDLPP